MLYCTSALSVSLINSQGYRHDEYNITRHNPLSSLPPPSIAHGPAFSPYRPHLTHPYHQTYGDPCNAG